MGEVKVEYVNLERPKEEKLESMEKLAKRQSSIGEQVKMKRITREILIGKESAEYQAAIIGDQVGDPMKAAAGPAISVLMRMICMISLIFGDFFVNHALCPLL